MSFSLIILVVVILLGGFALLAYNRLVRQRLRVKEAWSDIDVQFKRRHDLIPNLVETVKGYARHEQSAFAAVTQARAQALSATTREQQAAAQNQLTSTLKSLFAVAEAYPDLKANTNFLELQRELSDTENKIQAAHRFYNSTVRDYNTSLESVPTNILASLFGFKPEAFFTLDEQAARSVPHVSL